MKRRPPFPMGAFSLCTISGKATFGAGNRCSSTEPPARWTSAVQLARQFGAEVTAVCGTTNLELARSLGADTVIDYTKEHAPSEGKLYDLVFDAVGKRKTSRLKVACEKALAPGGKYTSVDDGTPHLPASDLAVLKEAVEAGNLKPVIDRCYPLEQIAEAHRYVEQEHKKGNVVVTVTHEP